MTIETFKTKENKCPLCDKKLDAVTGVLGKKDRPKPDDFSMCAYCGVILRFNEDLSFRAVPDTELIEEKVPPESLAAIFAYRKRIKRGVS